MARGTITNVSSYAFTIRPPWYRTWWAYLLYALGGMGVIVGAVQWRTLALRKQQHHLEAGTLDLDPHPCALGTQLARHARTFEDAGAQHDATV